MACPSRQRSRHACCCAARQPGLPAGRVGDGDLCWLLRLHVGVVAARLAWPRLAEAALENLQVGRRVGGAVKGGAERQAGREG